jgi:hypothetical protein
MANTRHFREEARFFMKVLSAVGKTDNPDGRWSYGLPAKHIWALWRTSVLSTSCHLIIIITVKMVPQWDMGHQKTFWSMIKRRDLSCIELWGVQWVGDGTGSFHCENGCIDSLNRPVRSLDIDFKIQILVHFTIVGTDSRFENQQVDEAKSQIWDDFNFSFLHILLCDHRDGHIVWILASWNSCPQRISVGLYENLNEICSSKCRH